MPIIALLARQFQNAVFWGPVTAKLKEKHDFTFRLIDKTPSVPGDLTLAASPVTFFFLDDVTVTEDLKGRIQSLQQRRRSSVLVVQSKDNRAWERIQLQITLADLSTMVIPAVSSTATADAIASFVNGFVNAYDSLETLTVNSAQFLRVLELDDDKLVRLHEKLRKVSDLVHVVRPLNRECSDIELGEDVVQAIEMLLTYDDAY